MRFITELSAKLARPQLDDSFADEKIVVQGPVDVCFVEEDGIVILDFKTDHVDSPEALTEAYGEQLRIYSLACEKIFENARVLIDVPENCERQIPILLQEKLSKKINDRTNGRFFPVTLINFWEIDIL